MPLAKPCCPDLPVSPDDSKPPDDPGLLTWIMLAMVSVVVLGCIVLSCPANGQSSLRAVPDPQFAAPLCPPKGVTVDATVLRVIDGDTIVVRSHVDYHVRLLDCWAPESRTKDQQEKARGLQSKSRMQQLVPEGTAVRVHLPGQSDISDMVTMGRVLGRVWLLQDNQPDPQDLSAIMVRESLATTEKQKAAP